MPESDPDTDRLAAVGPNPFRAPVTGPFALPEPTPSADTFDPFNTNTWQFKAPPAPWHQSNRTRLLLLAILVAAAALVIAVVMLATSRGPTQDTPAGTPTATTTTSTTTATTSSPTPPPSPPPPAEPPPAETPDAPAPGPHHAAPSSSARGPELNVTRMPMSAAPQHPHRR